MGGTQAGGRAPVSRLSAAFEAAHAARDPAALCRLYGAAAEAAESETARAFFLTHAWIFALEAGLPEADALAVRLRASGHA